VFIVKQKMGVDDMTTAATDRLTGRSLVDHQLFDRLVTRLVATEGHSPAFATRVVDQALAFLGTSAKHRGEPLSPSSAVDPGWHVFVLHTREYREFCRRIAGRFIDHVPIDTPRGIGEPALAMRRTVMAVRAAGYAVDDELWSSSDSSACTGCHNGCHDDPPPADG
jgi:hypothetical protein